MAAPPAEPKFEAGPPSLPPPTPAPGQRRFNLLIIGLTILLAAGLVGGLLLYDRQRKPGHSSTQPTKEVRQAYLNFMTASAAAYKQLDVAPLQGLVTNAGLTQEQEVVQHIAQTGHRYQIRTAHDLQIVVYASGTLASVDDNMSRHTLPLDILSEAPDAPVESDIIHESCVLRKENSRWLVDSVLAFGTNSPEPDVAISYAAASKSQPLNPSLKNEIDLAYKHYWTTRTSAFESLNVDILGSTEMDPELGRDRSLVDQWRQRSQVYKVDVEHNYRIAQQDDSTAWVYDTYVDSSYPFDLASNKPVQQLPPEVVRKSFQLKKDGGTWKVALDTIYQ